MNISLESFFLHICVREGMNTNKDEDNEDNEDNEPSTVDLILCQWLGI